MTEEEQRWENEGGACRPDPRSDLYYDTPEHLALERLFDERIAAAMGAWDGQRAFRASAPYRVRWLVVGHLAGLAGVSLAVFAGWAVVQR
jgi:hypothetical protein